MSSKSMQKSQTHQDAYVVQRNSLYPTIFNIFLLLIPMILQNLINFQRVHWYIALCIHAHLNMHVIMCYLFSDILSFKIQKCVFLWVAFPPNF